MKCTFKCTIQVYELAPPTCVLKVLIDPNWSLSFVISLLIIYIFISLPHHYSLYTNFSPFVLISLFLSKPYLCTLLLPFVINDHKGSILDRLRLSKSINGVRIIFPILSKLEHLPKIFNSVWSKDKLPHTSFQGLSWPCWVKHI